MTTVAMIHKLYKLQVDIIDNARLLEKSRKEVGCLSVENHKRVYDKAHDDHDALLEKLRIQLNDEHNEWFGDD